MVSEFQWLNKRSLTAMQLTVMISVRDCNWHLRAQYELEFLILITF